MQRDALIEIGKQADDESDTPILKDFGFHYPAEYVRRAYLYVNRGWGWPDGNGWANEDQRLLDDLDTYHEQYMRIVKAVREGGGYIGDHHEDQQTTVERRRFGLDTLG